VLGAIREQIDELLERFPLYPGLDYTGA